VRPAALVERRACRAQALPQFLLQGTVRARQCLPLIDDRREALGGGLPCGGVGETLRLGGQRLAGCFGLVLELFAMLRLSSGGSLQFDFCEIDLALQRLDIAHEGSLGQSGSDPFDHGTGVIGFSASIGESDGDQVDLDDEVVVLACEECQTLLGRSGGVLSDDHFAFGCREVDGAVGVDAAERQARARTQGGGGRTAASAQRRGGGDGGVRPARRRRVGVLCHAFTSHGCVQCSARGAHPSPRLTDSLSVSGYCASPCRQLLQIR
jgi:hypothetical protein